MKTSGIYKIENRVTGKVYIGSAVNISNRWNQHKSELRNNKHANGKLQNSWNKYGEDSFEFTVMLYCEKKDLLMYEQRSLDSYNSAKDGLNICITAGSQLGLKRSEAVRKAKSEASKLRRHSDETKQKMKESQIGEKNHRFGKPVEEDHRRKLSEALIGKTRPPRSEEWCRKISESKKGKKLSEESKENMANAQRGKTHSEETKLKISLAAKGRKRTEESKRKQSESRLKNNS